MYMLFDTSEKDVIHLAWFDTVSLVEKKYSAQNRELLTCVDVFLHEQGLNKKMIQGIMVVVGSGGFTSTRLATTVANSFAYVFHIPVLGISKDEAACAQDRISNLLAVPKGRFISATYSGQPNIGGV